MVLLERILRYGEDENLLPVTKRSFTFPKSSFYINDTLDVSQLSILARYLYLEGDAFSVGLLLCMHTGIRIGELCGLKGGDFNLLTKPLRFTGRFQGFETPSLLRSIKMPKQK